MKRLLCLLLVLLLLTGCAAQTGTPSEPTDAPEAVATEPPTPWISEVGMPWDRSGALTEIPLTIPDGLHYTSTLEFDGDLLLWSTDSHLADNNSLELCLLDLDTGTVAAESTVTIGQSASPQILGDQIYVCDSQAGKILQLDKSLQIVNSWSAEPFNGSWYMGPDQRLYIYNWDGEVYEVNLATGERAPLLALQPYISYFNVFGNFAEIDYYESETGALTCEVLDLITGEILEQPIRGQFESVKYIGGTWLLDEYDEQYTCYVGTGPEDFLCADVGCDTLQLIDESTILCTDEDGCTLSLHSLSGKAIAQCTLTENPFTFQCSTIIPSETFGGYFLVVSDYSGFRLLYWDTTKGSRGEDIPFAPIVPPTDEEAKIQQRVDELQERFGVSIFVGDECRTAFYDYTAETVTDPQAITIALDTLEDALSVYPEGFLRQLRYGSIHSVEIHLVGTLTPYDATEYVDTYSAFVQEEYDRFVMALDIDLSFVETYHHEFSHIIDAYLAWDAGNRSDALFSEDGWCSMNPAWFPGYTYTYSEEVYLEDWVSFIDGYSTIKPTEDRARVMEYAMAEFGLYSFEDSPILLKKLDYYCRCIRDAFDTTGWPDTLPWEQYLYLIN